MGIKKYRLLAWLLPLGIIACSTGHCRRSDNQVIQDVDPKPPAGYQQENLGKITVAKPDGSLQCQVRVGQDLAEMAQTDLKGVEILSSEKRSDGLMRIQSCGAQTGTLNTYTIRHEDLRAAQKAGFTVIKIEEK